MNETTDMNRIEISVAIGVTLATLPERSGNEMRDNMIANVEHTLATAAALLNDEVPGLAPGGDVAFARDYLRHALNVARTLHDCDAAKVWA